MLFGALAAGLVAYSFWVYLRVELPVAAGRWLALVRSVALVVLLLLLFNPRLPVGDGRGASGRWVLLDGSLSMSAVEDDGTTAWLDASERADALLAQGWPVVRFGGESLQRESPTTTDPDRLESRLAPALTAAAEAGVREVRVLTDARLEDVVAIRSALEALPLEVVFESFGDAIPNAGIARFDVPDVLRADGTPVAELDVFGEGVGDSITVDILEEGRPVATVSVPAPSFGLRSTTTVELPTPAESGRVRYEARVTQASDGFPADDIAVAYTNVGYEEGGVVLVSFRPDWEPRYLLPVLEEVTGLGGSGYLRAGEDRFVPMGRAIDRAGPVDSATVRHAASEATILVVHGIGTAAGAWAAALIAGPGPRLVFPDDPAGAALIGLDVTGPRDGEWYVSPDVPTSPIAGSLSGVTLEGLPPLSDVLTPLTPLPAPPLLLQLRGTGAPEGALVLSNRPAGRAAVALASGYWRWAMREAGREAYRRLWSGVAGWLLADRSMASAAPRPVRWVFDRSEPVEWSMPTDAAGLRIHIESPEVTVVDTTIAGSGPVSLGGLGPAEYTYAVVAAEGDTVSTGRFDVSSTTLEMLPRRVDPPLSSGVRSASISESRGELPLRTTPWPYLLVLTLLCVEWIVRRRIGLR